MWSLGPLPLLVFVALHYCKNKVRWPQGCLLREIPPTGVERSRKKALQHSQIHVSVISKYSFDSCKHHPSVNVIVLCLGLVALVAEHFIQYIDS